MENSNSLMEVERNPRGLFTEGHVSVGRDAVFLNKGRTNQNSEFLGDINQVD